MHIRHVSGMTLGLGSGSSLPCQAAYLMKYCRALALRSSLLASQVLNVIFTVYELGVRKWLVICSISAMAQSLMSKEEKGAWHCLQGCL